MGEIEDEDLVLARRHELCERGFITQGRLDFLEYTEDIDRAIDGASSQLVEENKGALRRTHIKKIRDIEPP